LRPNLSLHARGCVALVGASSTALIHRAVAMIQSMMYREANKSGLRHDWPRIPLLNSKDLLLASAGLGRKVADLLDPETDVDGVTAGSLRSELKVIGAPSRVGEHPLNPEPAISPSRPVGVTPFKVASLCRAKEKRSPDLTRLKSWRPSGKGLRPWASGACSPGRDDHGRLPQRRRLLALRAVRGVSYTVGGYQVMKKWLSYREVSRSSIP